MGLLAGIVVGVTLFLVVERRAADPVIPLSLFKIHNFTVPTIVGLSIGVAMFVSIAYLPTFLQMLAGVNATKSGLMMIPIGAGLLSTSITTGRRISATGRYKIYPILGTLSASAGMVSLSRLDQDTPYWFTALSMLALGLGIGLGIGAVLQNLTLIVQNSVPRAVLGTATSTQNYVRQIGAAAGIAIFGSMFISRLTAHISQPPIPGVPGENISSLSPKVLASLPASAQEQIGVAFSSALPPLFLYAVPIVLIGFVSTLFIREQPLQSSPVGRGPSE